MKERTKDIFISLVVGAIAVVAAAVVLLLAASFLNTSDAYYSNSSPEFIKRNSVLCESKEAIEYYHAIGTNPDCKETTKMVKITFATQCVTELQPCKVMYNGYSKWSMRKYLVPNP